MEEVQGAEEEVQHKGEAKGSSQRAGAGVRGEQGTPFFKHSARFQDPPPHPPVLAGVPPPCSECLGPKALSDYQLQG